MKISRDALVRVVRAARKTMKMANTMQGLMAEKNMETVADIIFGDLADALFYISGETLVNKSFDESTVMRLLNGDMDDESVADWLIMMSRIEERIRSGEEKKEEVVQPKPCTFSREEFMNTLQRNGGYTTPEGEWK